MSEVVFDAELVKRYDKSGPRYTSYPTVVQFHDGFNEQHHRDNVLRTNEDPVPRPLSLYFHLPFCDTVCFYCACNKIVTNNREHAEPYMENLFREIELQSDVFDSDRVVEQLHWGGGTPTFFSNEQMRTLMFKIRHHFTLADNDEGEFSIEVDPRSVTEEDVGQLRTLGFNRLSVGVQDFDPDVQKAINRVQSEQETHDVIRAARAAGFKSINMDLIYGLPRQTVASFRRTLGTVMAFAPDRLSIFNYAHLPERFKSQRRIREEELPGPAEKLDIYQCVIDTLCDGGYHYIGMDHFSRPDDELAEAQRSRMLTRNFQGYSTHGNCDILGMGLSAISQIGDCYTQNTGEMAAYSQSIRKGRVPVCRGIRLDNDDLLRRYVINQLICHFYLDFDEVEERFYINFHEYFSNELQLLQRLKEDGLVSIDMLCIRVLSPGRLLIRNICMVFDKYLRQSPADNQFSRVI